MDLWESFLIIFSFHVCKKNAVKTQEAPDTQTEMSKNLSVGLRMLFITLTGSKTVTCPLYLRQTKQTLDVTALYIHFFINDDRLILIFQAKCQTNLWLQILKSDDLLFVSCDSKINFFSFWVVGARAQAI